MDPRGQQGLLLVLFLQTTTATSGWGGCSDAQDVFGAVRENSRQGELIARLSAEAPGPGTRWGLEGRDADWFLLEDGDLRLNAAPPRTLDRELQGPVLMAELVCYEEEILQGVYRILVEILNENDNCPVFAENTVRSIVVSEMTPVNTVVFTVSAKDGDDDTLIYSIDQESPDAQYLKVDLPNSGEIVLAKPLDYETKSAMTVTIRASEMSTAERFSTIAQVAIAVVDGDDQYPQFLPCTLLLQDPFQRVCISPLYTANVTEGQEDIVLDLCPGPIHAVDGDRGVRSPIRYAILSGADEERFQMDRLTGELRLRKAATDPTLHLQVMAYQEDDPRKFTVASVLVHVNAMNRFPPRFERPEYHGFVHAGRSPASLLSTYGDQVLLLRVLDGDFTHGSNPMIHFSFSPASNQTALYQITEAGLVIARPNQLTANQRHSLPVIAVDQESGDSAYTSLLVEVLPEGRAIPYRAVGEGPLSGCVMGRALVLCFLFLVLLGCLLYVTSWLARKHQGRRGRGCMAQGRHPNVSLRWYQVMSPRSPLVHTGEVAFSDGELGSYNPSFSLHPPGVFIHRDLPPCRGPMPLSTVSARDTTFIPTPAPAAPVPFDRAASSSSSTSSPAKRCSSSRDLHQQQETPLSRLQVRPPPATATPERDDGSPETPSPGGGAGGVNGGGAGASTTLLRLGTPREERSPTLSSVSPGPVVLAASSPTDPPGPAPPPPPPPHLPPPAAEPDAAFIPPAAAVTTPERSRSPAGSTSPPCLPEPSSSSSSSCSSAERNLLHLLPPDAGPLKNPTATVPARLPSRAAGEVPPPCTSSGERGAVGGACSGSARPTGDADPHRSEEEEALEPDEEELFRVLSRLNPVLLTIRK